MNKLLLLNGMQNSPLRVFYLTSTQRERLSATSIEVHVLTVALAS